MPGYFPGPFNVLQQRTDLHDLHVIALQKLPVSADLQDMHLSSLLLQNRFACDAQRARSSSTGPGRSGLISTTYFLSFHNKRTAKHCQQDCIMQSGRGVGAMAALVRGNWAFSLIFLGL